MSTVVVLTVYRLELLLRHTVAKISVVSITRVRTKPLSPLPAVIGTLTLNRRAVLAPTASADW